MGKSESDKIDGKLCVTIGEKLNYLCAETLAGWLAGWDYYTTMMKYMYGVTNIVDVCDYNKTNSNGFYLVCKFACRSSHFITATHGKAQDT